MFFGRFDFILDDKRRFTIPSIFKRFLKGDDADILVMTRGIDPCIFVFPVPNWEHYMKILANKKVLDQSTEDTLKSTRMILSWACNCAIDAQGRVKIPPHLEKIAGLNRNIVISGHVDRMEIWDRDLFENYHLDPAYNYDGPARDLFHGNKPLGFDDEKDTLLQPDLEPKQL